MNAFIDLLFSSFYDVWHLLCAGYHITALLGVGSCFCVIALVKKIVFLWSDWGD